LETLLLNLARGAGARGLAAIPPVRGNVIRPLLCVTRDEIVAYLAERDFPHIEDSSNATDDYARNKIRHNIIPLLREINPKVSEHSLDTTEHLRADDRYLTALAREFAQNHCAGGKIPIGECLRLPAAISSRVFALVAGRSLSAKYIRALFELCADGGGSQSLALPGVRAVREYDELRFEAADLPTANLSRAPITESADEKTPAIALSPGESAEVAHMGIRVSCGAEICPEKINKSFTEFLFKNETICGKIIVRARISGDKIDISGRNVKKSLKKLFIEKKIPAEQRKKIPVIADDNGPIAVYGICQSARTVAEPGDTCISLRIERIG
jgi:tRNA(Ile)-lysidine synthase